MALGDLKTMIQIEQELQRIKDTYFSGREFTGEALENLNSLMEQLDAGHQLQYSASATAPVGVETVNMRRMMSQRWGISQITAGAPGLLLYTAENRSAFLPYSKRPAQRVYHRCGGLDRRDE